MQLCVFQNCGRVFLFAWLALTGSRVFSDSIPVDIDEAEHLREYTTEEFADLSLLFGEYSELTVPDPHDGYIMSLALSDEYAYVLIQNYEERTDTVVVIDRDGGDATQNWDIGNHAAAAIVLSRGSIWILSRNGGYFLRRFTLDGELEHTISVGNLPSGKLYGVAKRGDTIYFTSTENEISRIYRYDLISGLFSAVADFEEKIWSIAIAGSTLIAYQRHFDTYSSNWLLFIDLDESGTVQNRVHFVHELAWGLAVNNGTLFVLDREDDAALIYPVAISPSRAVVVHSPLVRRLAVTYSFSNTNQNAFELDTWIAFPADHSLQQVSNVTVSPAYANLVTDVYGNQWAHFRFDQLIDGIDITFQFDIITAAAAYTLPINLSQGADQPLYTSPTYGFDYEHPLLGAELAQLDTDRSLSSLLAVRDRVNDILHVVGPSGPQSRASDFIEIGEGRCYAHTLVFGAMARGLGYPTRAVGGLYDPGSTAAIEEDFGSHTWNQIYVEDVGWVDIDLLDDDDPAGNHTFDTFAYRRRNDFFITFEGNYDERQLGSVFTQRNWIRSYRWSSMDRENRAAVSSSISISSLVIPQR